MKRTKIVYRFRDMTDFEKDLWRTEDREKRDIVKQTMRNDRRAIQEEA